MEEPYVFAINPRFKSESQNIRSSKDASTDLEKPRIILISGGSKSEDFTEKIIQEVGRWGKITSYLQKPNTKDLYIEFEV